MWEWRASSTSSGEKNKKKRERYLQHQLWDRPIYTDYVKKIINPVNLRRLYGCVFGV